MASAKIKSVYNGTTITLVNAIDLKNNDILYTKKHFSVFTHAIVFILGGIIGAFLLR